MGRTEAVSRGDNGRSGPARGVEIARRPGPDTIVSRESQLVVPLYTLLAAEALLFALAAPSGKIPEVVLTLFRALLAL